MIDRTNEEGGLALVEELVSGPAGFILDRIAATPREPRPDFRLISRRGLAGYCEVKSPRDDLLDELLAQAPPGEVVGYARDDPTFNRIARHVAKAVKQFDTVNPDHSLPNVLVFVNHAAGSNFNDLYETVSHRNGSDVNRSVDPLLLRSVPIGPPQLIGIVRSAVS